MPLVKWENAASHLRWTDEKKCGHIDPFGFPMCRAFRFCVSRQTKKNKVFFTYASRFFSRAHFSRGID